ncbi:MAG: ferredoxin, partial [Rhizobiaceae bacterium]
DDLPLSQDPEKLSHPCDVCLEKPCLSACPVNAFSENGFAVERCRTHIATAEGLTCMSGGCLARRACPVGRQYTYEPEQMRFHMQAFRK